MPGDEDEFFPAFEAIDIGQLQALRDRRRRVEFPPVTDDSTNDSRGFDKSKPEKKVSKMEKRRLGTDLLKGMRGER